MANPFFSGRIPPGLADKIDAHLLNTGETRSELLVRLLRAEVGDNKCDNDVDSKYDNVLSELVARIEKLEQTINNKHDNVVGNSSDNQFDNTVGNAVDNKSDNVVENVSGNKSNNTPDRTIGSADDNKLDNIFIGLTLHRDDNESDNDSKPIATDNKVNNERVGILQDDLSTIDLTPVQLADLKKVNDRIGKTTKAKSKKLMELKLIAQVGEDLIVTHLGEAVLAKYQG